VTSGAVAAALALMLAASAPAAPPADVVEILRVPAAGVRVGTQGLARIAVRVKPGYHVQANPVLDPALVPISITMEHVAGVEFGTPRYPPASRLRLQGADFDLVVLGGTFTIGVPLRVSSDVGPGTRTLRGALRYQACDKVRCLFPRMLPIDLPVIVAPAR
jgi:hypothetical protein